MVYLQTTSRYLTRYVYHKTRQTHQLNMFTSSIAMHMLNTLYPSQRDSPVAIPHCDAADSLFFRSESHQCWRVLNFGQKKHVKPNLDDPRGHCHLWGCIVPRQIHIEHGWTLIETRSYQPTNRDHMTRPQLGLEKTVAPTGSRQSEETRNLKPQQVTGVAWCSSLCQPNRCPLRNPAPVDRCFIPFNSNDLQRFIHIKSYQLVQDFATIHSMRRQIW